MKRITLIIFFFSIFLCEMVSAQSNFNLSLGGGYVSSALDKSKLPNWKNGYLFYFSTDYKISGGVALFFNSSFQQHYFYSNSINLAIPQVEGYRFSINGENSTLIELSIGSRFYLAETEIRPYVGIGTGLLIINQGKIEIAHWMEDNPQRVTTFLYSDSDKNYNVAQYNFSLGLEIEIINNFNLVLDGKWVASFSGPSYFPLTAAIKFGL